MAATPSTMVSLGKRAPAFSLRDVTTGKTISLPEDKGTIATVVIFICNHCPYVTHINPRLVNIAADYKSKDVKVIAISSNDVQHYPQDGPEQMKLIAEENHYSFPYLYDDSQEVARAYDAACTPDLFVYDHELKLVYRGQFDDSRPSNNIPVTGKDLCSALDALIEGRAVSTNQKASIGCNIKWKRG